MFLIDFVSTFIFKIYKVYLFYIISLVYNMVRVGSYVCAGWYLNLPAVCILYITIKPMVCIKVFSYDEFMLSQSYDTWLTNNNWWEKSNTLN